MSAPRKHVDPIRGLPPAIPSLTALQAVVRNITETLAAEVARPTLTPPDWSVSEWLVARAVASVHGVSPLMARSIRWQGPEGWQRFLTEQRTHTERRHAGILDLLGQLDTSARDAGIALLALKGAALHSLQIYLPGERPMADVDLLVREEDCRRTGQMIEGLGFYLASTGGRHEVYTTSTPATGALGENCANGLKIELHSRIREELPARPADLTACIFPHGARPGLNDYPSKAALMLHLLLHAAGAMAFRALRLIHLNDIARVCARMETRDWDELLANERALDDTLWWSYPPLMMAARYYDCLPQDLIDDLSLRCHWWLKQVSRRRWLSDVSLSHLWVTAFPGIEWARSPREAVTYISRRIAPNSHVRSLRTLQLTTEPAAAHSTWAHMSQTRRLLRWLTSRPARPESLYPIELALAEPH